MPRGLEGRSAIVTGAGRGIGLAIARRLASEGARIIISGRDPSAFDRTAAGVVPLRLDTVGVADPHAAEAAVAVGEECGTTTSFAFAPSGGRATY